MKKKKGGKEMGAAPVKPIRPTTIEFENEAEMQRFINYATSNRKTKNEALDKVRERRKNHKPAREMK
ncbi:hypothetical protein [Aneurinibacillus migulanus]|uniref:hypothetical protein n=1 Tax=Aneurinibacillus migulanus TaxID=47500 RepID=UPI000A4C8EDC|nr:hypothetical protein [Aneurinibacillus migulanus]MED4732053.1 hypothetical protein [Aneurinibacillus migulanus]